MRQQQGKQNVSHVASRDFSFLPLIIAFLALAGVLPLAWLIDSRQAAQAKQNQETVAEELYLAGERVSKVIPDSLRGLAADWYWMRTLQYVGKKSLAHGNALALDDLRPLNLKLLPALLDTTVKLDPQFIPVYEYGAVILPTLDSEEAVRFIEDAIKRNPDVWRLYHHLGYINWQRGAYAEASRAYNQGALIANAPGWLRGMAARVEADGGNRSTAREMYERIYIESDEAPIKEMAKQRLIWLQSLDERDRIRNVIAAVSKRKGKCPDDWREMTTELRVANLHLNIDGTPLDPTNVPYVFKLAKCEVELGARSHVIYK